MNDKDKQERLAAALRENLRKRKTGAVAAKPSSEPVPPSKDSG